VSGVGVEGGSAQNSCEGAPPEEREEQSRRVNALTSAAVSKKGNGGRTVLLGIVRTGGDAAFCGMAVPPTKECACIQPLQNPLGLRKVLPISEGLKRWAYDLWELVVPRFSTLGGKIK